jgi:hypothetical protein
MPCDTGVYELLLGEAQQVLSAVDEAPWIMNERRATLGLLLDDDGLLALHSNSCLNGFVTPGVSDALGLAAPSFIANNLMSVDGKRKKKRKTEAFHTSGLTWQPLKLVEKLAYQQVSAVPNRAHIISVHSRTRNCRELQRISRTRFLAMALWLCVHGVLHDNRVTADRKLKDMQSSEAEF